MTTGEVVTDAFAKSVGTSKATLEDAAKSAAQTVHNVVKKATSSHDAETKQRHNQNQNQNQNELWFIILFSSLTNYTNCFISFLFVRGVGVYCQKL